jgi:alkanesulfonate monooxygenase SsuD/methylene tetrahydromethanopterin reductase-like flavin-dependent oxidoreductase (luciferase family)
MLGSSQWSSKAAAEFGLPYAFAHFFFGMGTREAIEEYQRAFRASSRRAAPEAMAAVGVICAETEDEADFLASSVRLLQRRIRMNDRRPVAAPEDAIRELAMLGGATPEEGEWPRYFVGTPAKVRVQLEAMAAALGIDELVVNTIVWDHVKRLRSYELLAQELELDG